MTIELLNEVLDKEINEFVEDFSGEYDPTYQIDYVDGVLLLNIYELMHLMIIWAAKQNFKVEHELSYGIERGRVRLIQYQEFDMYDVFGYKIGRDSKSDWFKGDSIPDAVAAACQWILENKK